VKRSKNRVVSFEGFLANSAGAETVSGSTSAYRHGRPQELLAHLAGGPRFPTFAAGIHRNFCFTRNRPAVGSPHGVMTCR
jgi:hypothetical protein